MKALGLWQPWATLIAVGAKRVETRSWRPPYALYGERIAIHATKTSPALERVLEDDPVYLNALHAHAGDEFGASPRAAARALPRGAIVATAVLAQATEITAEAARALELRTPLEFALGDYTAGRFAWALEHVRRVEPPVEARGSQGFFNVELDRPALF